MSAAIEEFGNWSESANDAHACGSFDRGDHVEIAQRLIAQLRSESPTLHDEGELHQYNARRGLWLPVDRTAQSVCVQGYAGEPVGPKAKPLALKASDVAGSIRLAHDLAAAPQFFADAPHGLAFADCFVSVTTSGIVVKQHAPENRARYGYSFAYDAGAAAPKWVRFLEGIFRDDADRAEKISLLQEFFGGALIGHATTHQRCIVAVGDGNNGKSKLGEIIAAAMPAGSTCAIPPQLWGQEYRRARLAGKLLNIVAELPESDILDSEAFKAIVAGDVIEGRVIRETPFDFKPRAGHYFAANRLPGTRDQSDGFWRRLIVVAFNRSFTNDPARNPRIAEEIISAELPAIVAWLVQGAARLAKEREYTIPPSHHAAITAWRRSADTVAMFASERTRPDENGRGERATRLYEVYRRWCEQTGHRPLAANKFGERMAGLGFAARKGRDANRYPVELTVEDCGGPVEDSGLSPPP